MKHLSIFSRMRRPRQNRRRTAGFTLVEMIVTMTVFALLCEMLVSFNVESISDMYNSEQKLSINKDMRNLTEQLSWDARQANFFVLYANYTEVAANTSANAPSLELPMANSGDFVVFVSYGSNVTSAPINVRPISEIVGYYRAPYQANQSSPITDNGTTVLEPVRRFDISVANGTLAANKYLESVNVPAGGSTVTLESLLPSGNETTIDSHQIVVQLAQGLTDNCLFHNFWGKSVMLNGKIESGNNAQSQADTYNFTVSPRG
jgi:prepilin-type N-terminal cleavage/methylation domain-containing protein